MSNFSTTRLSVTSRASVKIGDSYYTFESTIEKSCPPEIANTVTFDEINETKKQLWDEANAEVDNQIIEISEFLKKKR